MVPSVLKNILIFGCSDRCVLLNMHRIKHASSTIAVARRDFPSHNLPFVLISQGKVILSQSLVVYYIKSLLHPDGNIFRKNQTSIAVLRAGLIYVWKIPYQQPGTPKHYFGH